MNKINSLHERDVSFPDLKKKVKKSLLQRLLLFNFLVVSICSMWSQTAPSISYASPQNYLWNAAITTLAPVNSGGSVPALNYKQVSTLAGTTSGFLDGTRTAAKMDGPLGMTMDASGNVYFVDSANFRIRKMTPAGVVTTIAGDGYSFLFYGRLKNNATGSSASFSWPSGIVLDTANNCLYVADKENDVIRKVSLTGTFAVTTFAGSGTSSSLDGIGTAATFKKPNGIAIDPTNTYLYVTDRTGNKIRRITISNAQVLTIAGSGTASTVDNATGTSATFNDPTGIAVDANFIYVSDFGGNKIRRIASTAPYAVITFAGSGTASSLNGMGAGATFDGPFGITLDGAGNLFVAEWGNKIRKITPDQIVTTIAGNGVANSVDGNGTAAAFNNPSGIVINPTTSVAYVSEWTGDRIRKLELGGYTLEIELGGNYEASSSLPSGLTLNKLTGSITGIPTTINNGPLFSSITAFNYYGSSSTSIAITTGTIPTLTTTVASTLTHNTASTGGNVTANGGSTLLEKGICWSTTANPTILDTKVVDGTSTTGSYTAAITGLSPTTTYYTRAYATNVFGTSYGTQVSFTTLITPPAISYTTSNQFTANTPITPLQVTNSGGLIPSQFKDIVSTLAGNGAQGSADGAGTDASFKLPGGVALDAAGNVYVADTYNHKIRKITPSGVVSTLAGSGTAGNIEAFGTSARFNYPRGVAVDATGTVYVADTQNHIIRRISPAGEVTFLTGSGQPGSTDAEDLDASFNNPTSLTVNAAGIVYVADASNHKIRKFSNGTVSTFAGNGIQGSTDGASAAASFNNPYAVAVDAAGNFYVADYLNNKIRKIFPTGEVTTLAGSGALGSTDGTGTAATFNSPGGVAVDALGNVYVADSGSNKIRKITPAGIVSTLAGTTQGFNDGVGASAKFEFPYGISVGTDGNVFIADTFNNRIRKITQYGYSITPVLPAGLVLNADGSISGTPTVSSPATDYIVTATNSGGSSSFTLNLAITTIPTLTTTAASAVLATSATAGGNVISDGYSLLSERGVCWSTSPNPTIADAKTTDPTGMGPFTSSITGLSPVTTYYVRAYATNSLGTAYGTQVSFTTLAPIPVIQYTAAANTYTVNTAITPLTITNTGGTVSGLVVTNVSTFAGSTLGYTNGSGTAAKFYNPIHVASDALGTIYVADTSNHAIRKISSAGVVTTLAGGFVQGNLDDTGIYAQFSHPRGIATDILGNVFVADGNDNIRKIDASGNVTTLVTSPSSSIDFHIPLGIVVDTSGIIYFSDSTSRIYKIDTSNNLSVFAGEYNLTGTDDGIGTAARFNQPIGLAIDAAGNIYVADTHNHRIRKITPSGVVTTIAGSTHGFNDGTGASAQFTNPFGITVDAAGNIYVAENSNRIRKITPMGVVTTKAGITSTGSIDGDATLASFNFSCGITSDSDGNLYVADYGNHKIRKITTSYGFSISPALPAGLVLNANGSITGTPTVATAATDYVVTATNSGGSSSYTLNFAVTTVPSLTTTEASAITAITATLGGNVTSDGYASVTARGVCWSTSPNPTIAGAKTTNGTGTGIFESAITGLSPVTAYYVRAYATNSVGTVYGNEFSFTTVLPLPIIQYSAAVTYAVNTAITPLAVSNTGGLVINSLAGVSTFAGSTAGYTDGTTNAQFSQPSGVVTDSNGNLFVADSSNNAIRKITPSGTVSTFAGSTAGSADGQGSAAQFFRPNSIAIDSNDNLYISDTGNHLIRKITASGLVSTLAGTARTAGFVDGTGTSAQFNYPYGLTLDVSGNVYVADNVNNSIRKITPAGVVSTYFVLDYMLRTLDSPTAVAFDSSGNLFVSQASSNGLVKILIADSYSELTNFVNNDPIGTITFDTNNTLYAAAGGFIFKAQEPYTSGTLFAGGSQGFADGALLEAKFGGIRGLTIDNEGVMYVADGVNNRIRKISPFGYLVSPALPSGLVLNANGSITGTPTEASPTTDYVVTAINSGGSAIYTLNLAVQDKPSVQTIDAIHILSNYADSGVTVISDNQSTITTIGVCWSTSINPTIANDLNSTTDITQVYFPISGLSPLTTYYYRAFATNGVGTSYGNELSFTTLAGTDAPPVITYNAINIFTANSPIVPLTVTNTGGTVQSYSVSPALPTGLALNIDGSITGTPTEASPATDYVVTATNSGGSSSYLMSITINSAFQAPIASAQTFSDGHTVADLVAIGTDLKWYADATGGTALVTTTPLVSGTYFVSQTIDAIESTRTSVEVTVKPLAPTATPQTFCSGTIADLVAIGTDLKWYDVATNGTALTSTTALATLKYYVSQTENSVESDRTLVAVTVNNSVAGTVSAGQLIVRGTQPAAISLTGNIGLVQWQSSLDKIKFTTIAGATSSMLTGDQMGILTRRRFYRAIIKSGDCSSVTSEVVEVWTTLATKIQDSQCGKTLASLTTNISANAVPGADYYRFKVVVGNTDPKTIVTRSRSFNLKSLEEGALLNTAYSISVATQSIGLWSDYGPECTLTTPSGITKIQNSQCGQTLASLSTNVMADAVAGVTNYRFKVVQGETTRFLETTARFFNLKSLDGGVFYNTTYTVSVATQYNGNWSNYGTECTVTTPSGLTKIKDSQCGTTLASLNTNVVANAVAGVSHYSFKVVQGGTTRTIEKVAAAFSLKSLVGGASSGTTYIISVATKYNGVWGDYGQACEVTTPGAALPSVSRQAATASVFVSENVSEAVSVLAYPNPFDATFKLDFQSSSDANILVSVYDMNGRLLENQEVKSSEINNLELGNGYPSGVYNAIITQGIEVKTIRVIKK